MKRKVAKMAKEETVRVAIQLPDALAKRAKARAAREGRSLTSVCVELLTDYLDRVGEPEIK